MIYLHIGQEKTGTTAVQSWLHSAANNDVLRDQNTLYASFLNKPNSMPLALAASGFGVDSLSSPYFKTIPEYRQFKARILDRLRELKDAANPDTKIIFSSEHLHARLRSVKSILRLKTMLRAALPGHKIMVILYIREQASLNASLHSESVKSAGKGVNPPSPGMSPYFDHVLNHLNTISMWAEAFGSNRLLLRVYDKNELKGSDSIVDFLDLIGLPLDPNSAIPTDGPLNQNTVTLRGEALKIKALINQRCQGPLAPFNQHINNALSATLNHLGDQRNNELDRTIRSFYAESNETLRQRFFPERPELFRIHESEPADEGPGMGNPLEASDVANALLKLARFIQQAHRA